MERRAREALTDTEAYIIEFRAESSWHVLSIILAYIEQNTGITCTIVLVCEVCMPAFQPAPFTTKLNGEVTRSAAICTACFATPPGLDHGHASVLRVHGPL